MHSHSSTKNKFKSALIIFALLAFTTALGYFYYALTNNITGVYFAFGFGIIYALISYFSAAKVALKVNRAQPIQESDHPEIYAAVKELADEAKIPMPKLYVVPDRAANAFATGRSPQHAHVAVTAGILDVLNKDELKGVLAHEISHVKNYDIRLMMVVFACVTSLNLIIDFIARSFFFNNDREGGGIIPYLIMSFISPIVGMIVQAAISRQREYAADLSGAEITHKPKDLASALKKIHKTGSVMQVQSSATAHLFMENPLKNTRLAKLFSTHPPIEKRIQILESIDT
jgi:heat shock protein HtpX